MKICTKCGAYNSDERFFCVDCNEKLGDKLSAVDEQQMRDNVNETIEEMYNRKDPLFVSKLDKVLGTASLIGALCCLVLVVIGKIAQRSVDLLWVGLLFFLLAGIEALVPKVTWAVEKIRLSFFISDADNAEPSEFYTPCRKAAIIISAAVGAVILALSLASFRHPPIRQYVSDIAATESVGLSSHSKDYIEANPEKWQAIIDAGDYTVNVFLSELEKANTTGLEERIMMDAIIEISGRQDLAHIPYKDAFVFVYNMHD